MQLSRELTAAALAAACALLSATPAAAEVPDGRGEGVAGAGLSCSGDVVRVTAVVRGLRDVGPMSITLLSRAGSGPWTSTGRRLDLPTTKPGRSTWTLDAAGLPAAVTSLRADLAAAGAVVSTPPIPSASCAPGTEVPEVPAAALVPLTLAATAGAVLVLQGRRAGRPSGVAA